MKTATNMFATALIIVLMMLVSSTAIFAADYTRQDLDKALAGLKNPNLNLRMEAINFFLDNPLIPEAYEPLLEALNSETEHGPKFNLIGIVSNYKNPSALPAVIKFLNDAKGGNNFDLDRSFIALMKIGGDDAQRIIDEGLKSDNTTVKNSIIVALSYKKKYAYGKEYGNIASFLSDKDKSTRIAAIRALGRVGSDESFDKLQPLLAHLEDFEVYDALLSSFAMINNERSVDAILLAFKDVNVQIRVIAGKSLGSVNQDRAIDALINALSTDKEVLVRKQVIGSLIQQKNARAIPALIAALKDNNAGARSAAALALGREPFIDKDAFKPLLALLDDEAGIVSASAAQVLGAYKDKEAIDPLIKALQNDYNKTRSNAVTSLFAIGGDEELDVIGLAMGRELDHTVLHTMIAVMKKMTDKVTAAKYIETATKNARKDNQKLDIEFTTAHLALVGNTTGLH